MMLISNLHSIDVLSKSYVNLVILANKTLSLTYFDALNLFMLLLTFSHTLISSLSPIHALPSFLLKTLPPLLPPLLVLLFFPLFSFTLSYYTISSAAFKSGGFWGVLTRRYALSMGNEGMFENVLDKDEDDNWIIHVHSINSNN